MSRADVIVVGAGGSGAVVAARLSENPARRVVLLESGRAASGDGTPAGNLLEDAASLVASVDPRTSWSHRAELLPGRPWGLARGRALGGSTAVNAGYYVAAAPDDLALWEERTGWSRTAVTDAYARALVPVETPPQDDPLTRSLRTAAAGIELDLVPLPINVREGRRWDTGRAYLAPAADRNNLDVVTGAHAVRVETRRRGRRVTATGVLAQIDGQLRRLEAPEVVLCAGAIGTPHLLLLSGIGPAADLERLGMDVAADLPIGRATSDHPQVAVPWTPRPHIELRGMPLRSVVHADDVELLPLLRPTDELLGRPPRPGPVLDLLVSDQVPEARGRLTLDPADPSGPPLIRSGYLASERDRGALRDGVRLAVSLLRAATDVVAGVRGPSEPDLASAARLDAWVRDHLGTALHLAGSAPAGRPGDPAAVTDPAGRVLGVTGLRIVDLSILPRVPSRGPAATAVMLGELLAEHGA